MTRGFVLNAMPFSPVAVRAVLVCGGALVWGAGAQALPAKPVVAAKPAPAAKPVVARPVAAVPLSGWNYQMADEPLEARWSFRARQLSTKSGEARAVFGWKDARNFALLRVTPTQIELWNVSEGSARKLGQSANGPGELGLQIQGERARVLRAGALQIEANLKPFGEGFGVATQGGYRWDASDVQPTEPVVFRDDFMRAQGPDDAEVPSQWQVRGDWKTSGALGPKSDAALNPNPFVFRASGVAGNALAAGEAVARAGHWFWSDYAVTAAVRATPANPDAPLVAVLEAFGPDNGIRGEIDFQANVARLKQGDKVLAQSAPFDTQAGQWHRVRLEPGPGAARLLVDGIERVRASNVKIAQGGVALRARVGGANFVDFDDVRVGPLDDKKGWGEGSLPERFQKDRLMKNWASAASAWTRDAAGTWWHTGDFFGAATVALPLPPLEEGAGIQIAIGAKPNDAKGADARVEVTRQGQNVRFATNFEKSPLAMPAQVVPLSQVTGATLTVTHAPGDKGRIGSLKLALNGRALGKPTSIPLGTGGTKIGVTPLRNGVPGAAAGSAPPEFELGDF